MAQGGSGPAVSKSRAELLLLTLGVDREGVSDKGIGGITRLQKLLFLLGQEGGVTEVGDRFEFQPYKAGPYSRKIYDELELLDNLGYVRGEAQGEAVEAEAAEIEELSFEQLLGEDAAPFQDVTTRGEATTADSFEERRFSLTEKGLQKVRELSAKPENKPFVTAIRKIKSRFASCSLQDLLYYVYTKYEKDGWTSESEIRDEVLRKGRLR